MQYLPIPSPKPFHESAGQRQQCCLLFYPYFKGGVVLEPLKLLAEATKNFPAANLVWIAIAVAAAATVISGLNDPMSLVAGSLFVVACILVFAIFAALYKTVTSDDFRIPGLKNLAFFLSWSFSIMLVLFVGMMLWNFATGNSNGVGELLARGGEKTGILPAKEEVVVREAEETQESVEALEPPNAAEIENLAEIGLRASNASVETCLSNIDFASLSVEDFENEARKCRQ